jgi:hypothetical protein
MIHLRARSTKRARLIIDRRQKASRRRKIIHNCSVKIGSEIICRMQDALLCVYSVEELIILCQAINRGAVKASLKIVSTAFPQKIMVAAGAKPVLFANSRLSCLSFSRTHTHAAEHTLRAVVFYNPHSEMPCSPSNFFPPFFSF